MKRYIILFILAMVLFAPAALAAESKANAVAAEAEKEYNAGNYAKAVELYNSLLQKEGTSAGLLYDLGNAYIKLHDFGQAMVCYQRARRLDPQNDKINNNISYLETQVDVRNRSELKGKPGNVSRDDVSIFRSLYNKVAADVRSDRWAAFAAMAFILFILFLADYIFTKNVLARKFGFFGGIFMLGFTIIFLIFAFCAASESERDDQAVIIASKIELLSEPNEKSKVASTTLNAGTLVEILKTEGGNEREPEWYDVRLNSEYSGWVKKSDLERI